MLHFINQSEEPQQLKNNPAAVTQNGVHSALKIKPSAKQYFLNMTRWFTGQSGGYTRGSQSGPYGSPGSHTKSVRNQRRMTENYGTIVNSSGPPKPYCMNKIFETQN